VIKIFHPQVTLHGAERDNSFIVQDVAGVELGQGWLQTSAGPVPAPDRSLRIRMYMDAHPAARDMLYGALYARARLLSMQREGAQACLVAECLPEDIDMRGYYAKAGFNDTDGEELFRWDLKTEHRPFYAPVGTTIAPTFLQSYDDMDSLLKRINHWSNQQHEIEWLMEASELPYFAVFGVYSNNDCIGEVMATGGDGEAVLEMLYTLPKWRRHHVATALMFRLKEALALRGAAQMRILAPRSNEAAMGLFKKLRFQWDSTVKIYPTLDLARDTFRQSAQF